MLFSPESLILLLTAFLAFRVVGRTHGEIQFILTLSGMLIAAAILTVTVWTIPERTNSPLTLFPLIFTLASGGLLIQKSIRIMAMQKAQFEPVPLLAAFVTCLLVLAYRNIWVQNRILALSVLTIVFALIYRNECLLAEFVEAKRLRERKLIRIARIIVIGVAPLNVLVVAGLAGPEIPLLASLASILTSLGIAGLVHALPKAAKDDALKCFFLIWPALLMTMIIVAQVVIFFYVPTKQSHSDAVNTDIIGRLLAEGKYLQAVKTIRSQSNGQHFIMQHFPTKSDTIDLVKFVTEIILLVHSVSLITVIVYKRTLRELKQYSFTS